MEKSKSETGVCAVAGVERTCVYHFEDVHILFWFHSTGCFIIPWKPSAKQSKKG